MTAFDAQVIEARTILRSVASTSGPDQVAWALGVTHAWHAREVAMVLAGHTWIWPYDDLPGLAFPADECRPGCAVRLAYGKVAVTFWDAGSRLLLSVPTGLVDELVRSAAIPADVRAELHAAAQVGGLGHSDAERAATTARARAASAAVWELARPAPTLLDLAGAAS